MTQRKLLASARHIVVEGPIGVGKTSLARRLAEHLDADTLLEQPEANPFLARFYQNRQRYALQTQLFFLFQRLDQMRDMAQPDLFPRTVISDYLMEKELLFASLTLSEDDYRHLAAEVDAAFEAVRGVGAEAVAAGAAGDRLGCEERRFEEHLGCFERDPAILTAHDASHGNRALVVGDQKDIILQVERLVVEQ